MSHPVERLASLRGRWWAEVLLRGLGLALLDGSLHVGARLAAMLRAAPPHGATPGELLLGAAAFGLLTGGLALLFEGPGLFRQVPIPPRSAWVGAKAPRHR